MDFFKITATTPRTRKYWTASFVIILQGTKELALEKFAYKYKGGNTIITPAGLPVLSRVVVENKSKPFLAIRIALDPLELHEVALKIPPTPFSNELKSHGIFSGLPEDQMLNALLRLVELSEEDAPVLGPLIIRELYYYLLKSHNGPAIRQFVLTGSKLQLIAEAVKRLRDDLTIELDVEKFARDSNMSRTSFFAAFKKVTAMSPIQFQKKLRLLEARHLLSSEGETAENIAFAVGYKSASQFNREYSRMFGLPPRKDMKAEEHSKG